MIELTKSSNSKIQLQWQQNWGCYPE